MKTAIGLAGLFLAGVFPTTSAANPDSKPMAIALETLQLIDSDQSDANGPHHRDSSLAIDIRSYWEEEFGPVVETSPDVVLPVGATGTIEKADFVGDLLTSRYYFASQQDDSLERFPAGEYVFSFSSPDDGPCVVELEFTLPDFDALDSEGAERPKIRNVNGWRDGKLCLPRDGLVIRWDPMGPSAAVQGDTDLEKLLKVTDEQSREVVVKRDIGDEFQNGRAIYPMLMFGEQEGMDLSGLPGLVEGRTYEVQLSRVMETVILYGNFEIESEVISRVNFKLFVDPSMSAPLQPKLHLSTDDEASTVSIRWTPRPDEEYLLLDDLTIDAGRINRDWGVQTHFSVPDGPGGDHVFTDAITSRQRFYRAMAFLR